MATIRATTKDAFRLFMEGSEALAEAEFNGILCDQDYIRRSITNVDRQHKLLVNQLENTELGKVWKKHFGHQANFDSNTQLEKVLYEDLGIEAKRWTEKKRASVNAESLESLHRDDINLLLKAKNLGKMSSTYLKNLLAESLPDGFIHPFFHLGGYGDDREGGASTYRSSSSDPNFQNQPNRMESDRKLIRRSLISRPDHRITGWDYGGIEVCISACYHQDKNMIRYIEKGEDMHRDVSADCFLLPPEQCSKAAGPEGKKIRFEGKNKFTFPQFYFSIPESCAKNLWTSMEHAKLVVPSNPEKSLRKHLKDKGIRTYEGFEAHIKKVCEKFWNSRFPGFGKWRKDWIDSYNRKGYFDMLTGFRVEGVLTQFQLANWPIQGPAFHCLLWSFIKVYQLWKKEGWKSKLVGQIHDELVADVHENEFHKALETVPKIMTKDLMKEWGWIVVPLETECESTPVEGNWYEKKEVK